MCKHTDKQTCLCNRGQKRALDFSELEVQAVANYVGTGTQTPVLILCGKYFSLLTYLISPVIFTCVPVLCVCECCHVCATHVESKVQLLGVGFPLLPH